MNYCTHTYEKTEAAKPVKRHLNCTKTKEITAILSEDTESYTRFMTDALMKHGEDKLISKITEKRGYSFKYRLMKLYAVSGSFECMLICFLSRKSDVADVDNHPDWIDFVKALWGKLGMAKLMVLIDMDDVTQALRVSTKSFSLAR